VASVANGGTHYPVEVYLTRCGATEVPSAGEWGAGMGSDGGGLTIGDLSERTGVTVATLRAWEARHGFPEPRRLASGHRRYGVRDVARIEQVRRDRQAGLSLEAAVERVRRMDAGTDTSIFAGLRRRHPELDTHVLTKRALLAVSRAIEDECCATAEQPVLVAGFQRERFYRQSEPRWRELARTASLSLVFADFATTRAPEGAPVEVALPSRAPLRREWAVVCHGPDAAAVLAGWERPGPGRPVAGHRRFEALWSADPAVVADAVGIALGLAQRHGPELAGPTAVEMGPGVADPVAALHRATALTNRIVAYLDRR
jgi:DICT domain-containing protein